MDNLPYDIHEHILSFLDDKVDRFAYVDAYNNVEFWKYYALSLTKGIKNKYNKPRVVTDKSIIKDIKLFRLFQDNDDYNMCVFCPCGCEFNFDKYALDSKIRYRAKKHLETNLHKKNMLNPKTEIIKKFESSSEYFELVNHL